MVRKIILSVFLFFNFFNFNFFNLYSYEIYISKLQGFYQARSEADVLTRKVDFISNELKKELLRQSSDIITYEDLGILAQKRRRDYDAEPITDTLDALAVSFFYNIDFILYGELYLGGENSQYKAQINVYSKNSGDIIHTIEYTKNVENDITFAKGLASTINQELMVKFEGYSEDSVIAGEKDDKNRSLDVLNDRGDRKSSEDGSSSISDQIHGADTKIEPEERIIGVRTSVGFFLQFSGEWIEAVMPTATVEEGLQFDFMIVDGKSFDFYLRPSILFNYAFAVQDPFNTYHRYIHYHSLAFKLNLDFFFVLNGFFGFFVGLGPHYKVDIIDFRTHSDDFYTDIPYALGLSGNLGVEFSLNKQRSFSLGLDGIFDFTFYNDIYIDSKFLTYFVFRI